VQETIEKALKTILRHEVTTLGSGRTDTGVHAKQQYMQFETESQLSNKTLISLNGVLPKDIVVNSLYYVAENASARFDALSRSYEYHINQKKSPFSEDLSYFFPKKIDLGLMNEAAAILPRHLDFQCFSKVKTLSRKETKLCFT
jgi:tRNA pseudouridine38-40 synthase